MIKLRSRWVTESIKEISADDIQQICSGLAVTRTRFLKISHPINQLINRLQRVQVLISYLNLSVSDAHYANHDLIGRLLNFALAVLDLFADNTKNLLNAWTVAKLEAISIKRWLHLSFLIWNTVAFKWCAVNAHNLLYSIRIYPIVVELLVFGTLAFFAANKNFIKHFGLNVYIPFFFYILIIINWPNAAIHWF